MAGSACCGRCGRTLRRRPPSLPASRSIPAASRRAGSPRPCSFSLATGATGRPRSAASGWRARSRATGITRSSSGILRRHPRFRFPDAAPPHALGHFLAHDDGATVASWEAIDAFLDRVTGARNQAPGSEVNDRGISISAWRLAPGSGRSPPGRRGKRALWGRPAGPGSRRGRRGRHAPMPRRRDR